MKTKSLTKILKPSGIEFDEVKHTYKTPQGELYTGCTTISEAWDKSFFLGPWYAKEMALELISKIGEVGLIFQENPKPEQAWAKLVDEAKGAARRKGDKAKEDGSVVHDWIEKYIASDIEGKVLVLPSGFSKEAESAVVAFTHWKAENKITWLASEEIVSSHEHRIGGKLDALAVIDGITYLVDFKTSGQISASYLLQCAGYDVMLREMGLQVMGYMIVRIPKDGTDAETLTITNQEDMKFYRETFLKQREAHKFYVFAENKLKENGKMRVDVKPVETNVVEPKKVTKPIPAVARRKRVVVKKKVKKIK